MKRPAGSSKVQADFSWIKTELKRQGKTARQLADYMGCHPTRISKIICGTYGLKNLDIDKIRSFFDLDALNQSVQSQAPHPIRVIGSAAEGTFVDPVIMRFKPLIENVYSAETEKWGADRYALELREPVETHPQVEKEWVICVPSRRAKREFAPDDLVHIEIQEGRLAATLVRRVQKNAAGVLVFADIHNPEMTMPSRKVHGLVVCRIIAMR